MKVFSLFGFVAIVSALAVRQTDVAQDLKGRLSSPGIVNVEPKARWSDYFAPRPSVVVKAQNENDVVVTVKYCAEKKLPFLAQNGANGWTKTFDLGKWGVLIDLSSINAVTVAPNRKEATISGGANVKDVINAANAAGALIITGNCNCVGALGAMLGGGYGNLIGEVGFGVDNLVSLRVILGSGKIVEASATRNTDLFWAMRGAGPNFGIVISAKVKATPAVDEIERTAFINNLFFSPDKLEQVAQAVQDQPLLPQQRVYLVFANGGAPLNEPSIFVTGFLRKGTNETGRAAFKKFYDIGPSAEQTSVLAYDHWNDGNDGFCTRGGRKPAFTSSITSMSAKKWPQIWDLYKAFQTKGPNSAILIERYNLAKGATPLAGPTAFNEELRRGTFAQAIVIPWYDDTGLDNEALDFGQKVRAIWSRSKQPQNDPTYANFAHGDESLKAIYGNSLERLKKVKKQWDPQGQFGQWFPIG